MSFRRLGDDVERALTCGDLAPPPLDPMGRVIPDAGPAGLQTGAVTRSRAKSIETERLFFGAPASVAQLFRALLATVQRRLERIRGRPSCTSDALEAPGEVVA